ncbi:MAG TPA: hypothetical protein VFQ38_19055, partial [Longimicrobiales bacterium]|nr:hypothetical protein [Longimicrobiales bacterium]
MSDAETLRLHEEARRERDWKRWGPYLSERQWGTVREDYSASGTCWEYFPHDHARSRAYRWGEDGLLGICDRHGRLNFALALWNGRDPILKERLFGLTGPEGNHGEDVKELYYYLDAAPTHSYLKALYKYPQREYPYARLVEETGRRTKQEPEYELLDTGVFDGERYFDVTVEYAKASPDDILVRITVANRASGDGAGPPARLHLLPQLWFRNTWSWGRTKGEYAVRPRITAAAGGALRAEHHLLGTYVLEADAAPDGTTPTRLFTENETNFERLYGSGSVAPGRKDAFHEYVVHGRTDAVHAAAEGTKAAFHYVLDVPPGGEVTVRLRLTREEEVAPEPFGAEFELVFRERISEADQFYAGKEAGADAEQRRVIRQGYAGLIWSKQFYHYVVREWIGGDPGYPPPPDSRRRGRNSDWMHVHHADVILMPDKWEYPWFAAWDLAFHVVSIARIDPPFAKEQLLLLLREGYMHPNGQIPAYEFAFGDVNPPVHAWAVWRVYKMTGQRGERDRQFLARAFHKLLLNFTWWVNRKDPEGHNLFAGGFLGLDNIGVF